MDVFISYRRNGADTLARLIYDKLKGRGYSVFIDVTDLGSGHFDEALLSEIQKANNFIIILSPNALDQCNDPEDWLRKETDQALKCGCNIIPVLMKDFRWPVKEMMPPSIQELFRHNGVIYSHEFFEAMMEDLVKKLRIQKKPSVIRRRKFFIQMSITLFTLLIFIIGMTLYKKHTNDTIPSEGSIDLKVLQSKLTFIAADMQNNTEEKSIVYIDTLKKYVLYGNKYLLTKRNLLDVELSAGNLLLGSSIILSAIRTGKLNRDAIETANNHYLISQNLENEFWKANQDIKAFNYFRNIVDESSNIDFNNLDFTQQVREYAIDLAKINITRPNVDPQESTVVDPQEFAKNEIIDFFNSYIINEVPLESIVGAGQIALRAGGGTIEGPEVIKTSSNKYIVRYVGVGPTGIRNDLDWEVDMETKLISPKSEVAELITNMGKQ